MPPVCTKHEPVPAEEMLDGQCPLCLFSLGLIDEQQQRDEDTAIQPGERLVASENVLTPGTVIAARFRIVSLLGRGGMGEIYHADDLKLGQPVALKFLSPRRIATPGAERFLYDEVRIGRQVAHPNICRIYDIFEFDGRPFIEMEFVDGEDLSTLLSRIRRLPYAKAIAIGRELCAGLAAAHEKGIIHGDLKPANVMIDGRGRARITDFGLSRFAAEASDRRGLAGTVAYMAPEQWTRNEVSKRTDVYALGLVLYEIFTGRRVREPKSSDELTASFALLPPPPSRFGMIESSIEDAIMRCLAADPEQRPPSSLAVLQAFPPADPIAEMIAAGDTPPPDLVAASGPDSSLRTRDVSMLLAAVLALLACIVVLARHATLYGTAALTRHPAALANQAKQLSEQLSWNGSHVDSAYWFEARGTDTRAIDFHWRSSPKPMLSLSHDGRLRSNVPPLDTPGMTHVVLDPSGHLVALASLPPESVPSSPPVPWEAALRAAGLTAAHLEPWKPEKSPPVTHDENRGWRTPRGSVVNASRFHGRLTSFEIGNARPDQHGRFSSSRLPHAVYLSLLMITLLAGAWVARRNLRAGRVDRRGAERVALWVFVCRLLYGVLVAHHPLTLEEEASLLAALLGGALLLAAEVWLGYVALEPLVRKLAPQALIAWARVSQGRIRDSLVGRDILIGVIAGLFLRLLDHLREFLPAVIPSLKTAPSTLAVETLGSFRMALAMLFHSQARSIFYALFALFLLVLFQHLFQRQLAASLVWLTVTTLAWSRWDDARVDLPVVALQMLILLVALRKVGLLASAVAIFAHLFTLYVPLTHRLEDFYFTQSLLAVTVLIIVVSYGTWAALGGQSPSHRAQFVNEPRL